MAARLSSEKGICVIFNPAARGERAKRWMPHLRNWESHCHLHPTDAPGSARTLASRAVLGGCKTVVAAGGDGTVNEVVNGIADVPGGLGEVRLGVLPMGTINVFARELGLSSKPNAAWRTILEGVERPVDLPRATFAAGAGTESRHFIQLAGAGFDARAVELVSWEVKKKLGMMAYIFAALQAYRGECHSVNVDFNGTRKTGEAVFVGNGQLYGGSHALFHRARFDDGLLDVLVLKRVSALILAQAGLAILTGNWSRLTGVECLQLSEFHAWGAKRTPIELDGEHAGELPASFRIGTHQTRVLAPLRPAGGRGTLRS